MEWIVPALGLLTAVVGAWVVWARMRAKTPLQQANEVVKTSGKAKEKIILDVQTKNTVELEKDVDRLLGNLRAIDSVRGKNNPS